MKETDLLIVGPGDQATGGIAQYISEQRRHLSESVSVTVHDTSTPNGSGLRWFLRSLYAWICSLFRLPARTRPDVVHVHTSQSYSFYLSSVYVAYATVVWRRPVVLHVHGSSFDEFVMTGSLPVRLVQRLTFAMSDSVIVLSEYWRDTLSRRIAADKLVVVPNAIEPDDYAPEFETEQPHLAFISNHIERKGIAEFADAIRALNRESSTAFTVTIAGDGPQSHHAEQLAQNYSNVEYRGYVSEAEKRRILERASIYVLPTYAEGLPIALLEGMAGGNAVVSTDVGSIPDVVGEENGVIVPPGDATRLTDALGTLVSAPDRVAQMSRANVRLIDDQYSWDAATVQLLEIYSHLLEREGPNDSETDLANTETQRTGFKGSTTD